MLQLIALRSEKIEAQRYFQSLVKASWKTRETRVVAWRPDSKVMEIYHNGKYWFGPAGPNPTDKNPRYTNWFGEYKESGNLTIAVEINIPTESNTRLVSGFFAQDSETKAVYLMHDGGVGGGREGVGRKEFLLWSSLKPMQVADAESPRLGIVVSPLVRKNLSGGLARYIQQAVDFKGAVEHGNATSASTPKARRSFDDYYDEFSGKKRRRRLREMEYISRHGDIVRALRDWRASRAVRERVVKNAYIDLGIEVAGKLTELYEVKTRA